MLAQSPEPEAHDKVLDQPRSNWNWECGFLRRGENRSARRKTSLSKDENQQQTQPTYDPGSGNQTRDTLVGGEYSHHCAIPAPCRISLIKLSTTGTWFITIHNNVEQCKQSESVLKPKQYISRLMWTFGHSPLIENPANNRIDIMPLNNFHVLHHFNFISSQGIIYALAPPF